MNELALFAGAGGGLLGSRLLGWKTVCAVEIEPYCREVLLRRQRDGVLDLFPIWDDVRTFDGKPWRGIVDVITAGFPCQPFSVAGQQRGADDDRNMWPETIRIIREVGPRFALLENVPGLISHDYFGEILGDLAAAGFNAEWDIVSAAEAGAPHLRKRLWIAAHASELPCNDSHDHGRRDFEGGGKMPEFGNRGDGENVANAESIPSGAGLRSDVPGGDWRGFAGNGCGSVDVPHPESFRGKLRTPEGERSGGPSSGGGGTGWWESEPRLDRVAYGVANRVDRLRAIGNGQVPAVVRAAWHLLTEAAQ